MVVNRDAHSPFVFLCLNVPCVGEPAACTKGNVKSKLCGFDLPCPSISTYFKSIVIFLDAFLKFFIESNKYAKGANTTLNYFPTMTHNYQSI